MSASTKDKLLDTAERLFAEHGFDATSLRNITAEARVNLAAVNYHFHNKESLLDAILIRKLTPVNAQREALLDRFQAEAGDVAIPIERVLEAIIAPTFAVAAGHPQFVKLMGRLEAEGIMLRLMAQHFQPLMTRFIAAMHRALPHLGMSELMWRFHFMIGAMAHTLRRQPFLDPAAEAAPQAPDAVARHLITFLAAGFRTPAILE